MNVGPPWVPDIENLKEKVFEYNLEYKSIAFDISSLHGYKREVNDVPKGLQRAKPKGLPGAEEDLEKAENAAKQAKKALEKAENDLYVCQDAKALTNLQKAKDSAKDAEDKARTEWEMAKAKLEKVSTCVRGCASKCVQISIS